MSINYLQLKNEIQTDPAGLGYAPFVSAGRDNEIARLLNVVSSANPINRDIVATHEIFEGIVPAEWTALSAAEKQRIQTILSMGTVDLRGANTRSSFQTAFGPATTTRANLLALLTRQGSRAETLFGSGTMIDSGDVGKALRET